MDKAVSIILILCGILSQGICHVSVSEGNNVTEKSSDLLSRQKRVVGGSERRLESSFYLLSVVENGNEHCPATLLTATVAISSAACFIHRNTRTMSILSHTIAGAKYHQISRVIFYDPNYNPAHPTVKNLALVMFTPRILDHGSNNRPIPIYNGNLARDRSTSRVVSWGRPTEVGGRRIPANYAETFATLLISIAYCHQTYPNLVGTGHICAVGINAGEYCETNSDSGVPLVKNEELLGIFVYRGNSRPSNPNVFMNLLDPDIRRWIHQHVPSLRLF